MHKLALLFALALSCVCALGQGTYTAASCNQSDVNAVINGPTHTAVNGDTIIIPAGTCTWTTGVTITVGITLTGSGTSNSGAGTFGAGTPTTIINDNGGSSNPLFNITTITLGQTMTLALMTIQPLSSSTSLISPVFAIGTCTSGGCPNFRMTNINFAGWTESGNGSPASWLLRHDNVFGVADHNTAASGVLLGNANMSAYLGVGQYGDNSYAQADTLGGPNNFFYENNSVTTNEYACMQDSDISDSNADIGGARIVVRYNHCTSNGDGSIAYFHGLDTTGRPRGGRQAEVYNNTHTCNNSGGCSTGGITFRSGDGYVYNNNYVGGANFYDNFVSLDAFRTVFTATAWGACGGSSAWDTNDGTVYYSGTTSTSGQTLTDASKSWTGSQFIPTGAPYSVYDVTQGWWSEIASNTSNTLTLATSIPEQSNSFNSGDNYQILRATVCSDQPTRGSGTYFSGSTPSPSSAAAQTLSPIYEWNDTLVSGSDFHGTMTADTLRIIANRDFYVQASGVQTNSTTPFNGTSGTGWGTLANRPATCTPVVGYWATDTTTLYTCNTVNTWSTKYTPYTYPHPLTTSGPATYYVSTTGNDSNPGTSGSPWLTPNHAVNCGDQIIASAGTYPTNPLMGTVSNCPSSAGNYFAKYKCAAAFACGITTGGAHTNGFEITKNNWAIEGWVVNQTTSSAVNQCFVAYPASGQVEYVMFDNDIATNCNNGGFSTGANGTAGVDHFFAVGDIAYNAATGSTNCTSGFDVVEPVASDSNAGTHYFFDGDFAYGNVNPNPCQGGTPTDGEGIIFDTLDGSAGGVAGPYCQQMAVENSILLGNGGRGWQVDHNTAGSCHAPIYVKNVTSWGNNSSATESVAGNGEFLIQTALTTTLTNNIGATNAATGAGGDANYGAYVVNVNGTDTVTASDFWSATGTFTGSAGTTTGFSYGTNLNVNPNFSSPSTPGSPSCGSFATTTACMASVISNFTPGNSSVTGDGYQPVGAANVDPLFPQELCNANLPTGLITLGCAIASATTITVPSTIAQAGVSRFGINLSGPTYFGNQQTIANLIATDNPSFEGQMYQMVSYCAGGSGTTWQDQVSSSPQQANFWLGATYQVIQGTSRDQTGTVTASVAASGGTGQIFTLSPAISACNAGADDMLLLRQRTPSSSWTGAPAPGTYPFNSMGYSGGATSSYETTDISPSSTATQHLKIVAAGSATATVTFALDATYPSGTSLTARNWINLNGSYTASFRAKGLLGAPMVILSVQHDGNTYETQNVSPTVNVTPGAGWNNYSYTFTASETGPGNNTNGFMTLTVTGGTAIIADAALTEARNAAGNTTAFRDGTYLKLRAWNPGVLRFMSLDTWGCSFDNMIATTEARQACGSNVYLNTAINAADPIGFNDLLVLANAVNAAPWFTMSFASNPSDWTNVTEFLNGSCATTYGAKRCALGQTATWASVFAAKGQQIYLEDGNEMWNSGADGADMWAGNGTPYGYIAGANFAAARTAPDWTSTIKLIASGWSAPNQNGTYGWGSSVLTAAATITSGQADMLDGAAYLFSDLTTTDSNQDIFGPMWTEPVNQDSLTTGLISQLNSNSATYGAKGAIYESGPGTTYALNSITQGLLDQVVDGVGAGLDEMVNALLILRDSKIPVQNIYNAFGEYNTNTFQTCSSTSGGCSTSGSIPQPLYANNWQSPGPEATGTVDRAQGIAYQVVNTAIGSNLNLLSTTQGGINPTFNQAAAQPAPNNGGTNSIAANSAVPYIQAFAFCHGTSSCDGTGYTLIVFNFNLTTSEAVTFSGAAAPTGTVTKTVFTSTNVTDNNELTAIGGTPTLTYPTSSTLTSPAGDTLAPFSMTTYTYGSGIVPSNPVTLSGHVTINGKATIQ